MFALEDTYARIKRKSIEKAREEFRVNSQRQWRSDEPSDAEGINLPGRCAFAQNNTYLELCNPGWERQRLVVFGLLLVAPMALLIIWGWYGFAIHPILFNQVIMFWHVADRDPADWSLLWFGWLLLFPLAAASAFMLFAAFYYMGARSSFFTYARGRIRFNRLTRKVYVLRPGYCGGNQIFEWDRLRALCDIAGDRRGGISSLALYHPPFDTSDAKATGEDCIFVGPARTAASHAPLLWEYIRLYMQEGPVTGNIPPNAPSNYKKVPLYLPQEYSTYCGKPSRAQYRLEQRPRFLETTMHMISQITCSWPAFPKEWQSDSGVGEPEDKPVQAGAVMTALVYRAQGKLSKADEIEFLRHWGTSEAQQEAMSRKE